jgi:outer membrane lipoprotein-sorting protein
MSNNYELLQENNELKSKISKIELELEETKEHLKQYTAPTRSKKYYENNKEEIKQKAKEYKQTTKYIYVASPEQKKEYARTAYLNKKTKLQKIKDMNTLGII